MGIEQELLRLISEYGYWAIAPFAFIEGNILLLILGLMFGNGLIDPVKASIIFIISDFLSDITVWWIGAKGPHFLSKIPGSKHLRTTMDTHSELVEETKEIVRNNFVTVWTMAKMFLIPQGSLISLLFAGFSGISLKKVIFTFIMIEPIKVAIFLSLGYYFGGIIEGREHILAWSIAMIGIVIVLGILFAKSSESTIHKFFPLLKALRNKTK